MLRTFPSLKVKDPNFTALHIKVFPDVACYLVLGFDNSAIVCVISSIWYLFLIFPLECLHFSEIGRVSISYNSGKSDNWKLERKNM